MNPPSFLAGSHLLLVVVVRPNSVGEQPLEIPTYRRKGKGVSLRRAEQQAKRREKVKGLDCMTQFLSLTTLTFSLFEFTAEFLAFILAVPMVVFLDEGDTQYTETGTADV